MICFGAHKCTKLNHNQDIIRVSFLENIPLQDRPLCEMCPNQLRSYLIQEAKALLPKIKPTSHYVLHKMQLLEIELQNMKNQLIYQIEKNFTNIIKMIEDEKKQLNMAMDLILKQEGGNKFTLQDLENLGFIFTNEYLNKRADFQDKIIQTKKELYDNLYASINLLKHQIEQKLPISKFKSQSAPPKPIINKILVDNVEKLQRFQYKNYKKIDAQFDIEALDFHINGKYVAVRGKDRFKLMNLEVMSPEIDESLQVITQIKFGHKGNWLLVCDLSDKGNTLMRYDCQEDGWLKTTSLGLEDMERYRHMEISSSDEDILLYQEKHIIILTQQFKQAGYRQAVLQLVVKQKVELGSYVCPIYSKGFSSYFTAISPVEQQLKVLSNTNEKQWKTFSIIKLQDYEEIQDIQFTKPSTFALLLNRGVLQVWDLYRDIFVMQNTITLQNDPLKLTLNAVHGTLIVINKDTAIAYAINLRNQKLEQQQEIPGGDYHASEDAEYICKIEGRFLQILKYEII